MVMKMNAAVKALTNSYEGFAKASAKFLDIQSETDYEEALEACEDLMISIGDTKHHHLEPLLELISKAVETYESSQTDIKKYLKKYNSVPSDIATLKVLIDQYHLNLSDFKDEIGTKSYVSMILKGERQLSKNHIEKLSNRFSISPALFF